MGLRPAQGDEKCFCSATTLNGSAALPFVISTEAQRSGEICGVSGPFLEMFFDRAQRSGEIRGQPFPKSPLRSTTALPFVISTEAQRSGEIRGPAVLSWECFSTELRRSAAERSAVDAE
jgi:hypothetical protein